MRYASRTGNAASVATDCLVVPRRTAREVAAAMDVTEQVDLVLNGTQGKAGGVARVFLKGRPSRLLIVGADDKDADGESKSAAFRRDAKAAATAVAALDVSDATVCVDDFDAGNADAYWKTRTMLEAVSHATYRFTPYKSGKPEAAKLRRVGVLSRQRAKARRAVGHAQALDEGLALAKDLGNQPPNVCNPTYLAREARRLSRGAANVSTTVLDEKKMSELGMGAFLSVTGGSATPGKMIIVNYKGGNRGDRPVVLVGKGITFDTGGISIKASSGMEEMKWDMCGAASVLGAMKAGGEHARRQGVPTERHRHLDVRPDGRDHQHRCRRPTGALRCAHLREALQTRCRGRRRHVDRRTGRGLGIPGQRHVCQ